MQRSSSYYACLPVWPTGLLACHNKVINCFLPFQSRQTLLFTIPRSRHIHLHACLIASLFIIVFYRFCECLVIGQAIISWISFFTSRKVESFWLMKCVSLIKTVLFILKKIFFYPFMQSIIAINIKHFKF